MVNLDILNDIELEQSKSELNVLYSICESYNKMLQIITETDDVSIIQECALFQEADDVKKEDKKSIKDYFLSILSKVFEAIKNLLVKIIDVLSGLFIKKKNSYIAVVNCLMILDAFQHVNVSSVVNEYGVYDVEFDEVYAEYNTDDFDADLVQERWSPIDEARYRKAEKNIAKAQQNTEINITTEQLTKGLMKFYNVEIRHHVMSKKEITDIVKCLAMCTTPDVLNELKNSIKKFENNDEMKKLSAEAQGYAEFIKETVDKRNQDKWKEICDLRRTQCKTYEQADAELKSMEALVDGVGKTIGKLTNQRISGSKVAVMDTLTTDALSGATRGCMDIAQMLWSALTQIPTAFSTLKQNISLSNNAIKNIKQLKTNVDGALVKNGGQLRDDYENFQTTFHEEEDKLKELGQRSTKLISTIKFCGDGIGEETIIINQDQINNDVYVPEKIHSPKDIIKVIAKLIYGGPCTFTYKIIATLTPFYVGWAIATANGLDQKQAAMAGLTTLGGSLIGKGTALISTATVSNVFKTLTGTALRGYAARKLTGDLDRKTPTMVHDEQEAIKKAQEKERRRTERRNPIPIPIPTPSNPVNA